MQGFLGLKVGGRGLNLQIWDLIEHMKQKELFLVQSFFETLQYCDEWRKFTSVSQSDSQSVSQ